MNKLEETEQSALFPEAQLLLDKDEQIKALDELFSRSAHYRVVRQLLCSPSIY